MELTQDNTGNQITNTEKVVVLRLMAPIEVECELIPLLIHTINRQTMISTLKLNSVTYIGRDEEKKLGLIISYLIDMPEAAEFIHPVDWEGTTLAS